MPRKDGTSLAKRKTIAHLVRDPNEDLVGVMINTTDGLLTVTGTPRWSDQYVFCDGADGFLTVRSTALLRAKLARR